MIESFRKFFARVETADEGDGLDAVQLSVAVLLVEIARADYDQSDIEAEEMHKLLVSKFDLSSEETEVLISAAEKTVENSVSLHDYTRTLHSELSYPEKESVIEMLWRIALADQDLDKYEDYMVGKIADLLYVYRGDVIRLKQRVIDALTAVRD